MPVDLSVLAGVEEYVSDTLQNIPDDIRKFVEDGYAYFQRKPNKWLEKNLPTEQEKKLVTALAKRYVAHRDSPLTVRTRAIEAAPGKLVYKITDKQSHKTGA